MLKRLFALSDQGSKDLNKGIAATTLSNICLIIPASLLIMVIWELLNVISGESSGIMEYVPAIGKTSVENALKTLVQEGIIGREGKGKATFYFRKN